MGRPTQCCTRIYLTKVQSTHTHTHTHTCKCATFSCKCTHAHTCTHARAHTQSPMCELPRQSPSSRLSYNKLASQCTQLAQGAMSNVFLLRGGGSATKMSLRGKLAVWSSRQLSGSRLYRCPVPRLPHISPKCHEQFISKDSKCTISAEIGVRFAQGGIPYAAL